MHKPDCEECRALKKKKNQEPQCIDCREEYCEEELYENNIDAIKVYRLSKNQVIQLNEGVDLNLLAVKAVMDIYKVKDQEVCLQKVTKLFRYFINVGAE